MHCKYRIDCCHGYYYYTSTWRRHKKHDKFPLIYDWMNVHNKPNYLNLYQWKLFFFFEKLVLYNTMPIHANGNGNCHSNGFQSLCHLPRQKQTAKTAKIGPKIGQFLANFWLNLGKIMGLFDTKKFLYIFGWKLAQNRSILSPFLAEYVD